MEAKAPAQTPAKAPLCISVKCFPQHNLKSAHVVLVSLNAISRVCTFSCNLQEPCQTASRIQTARTPSLITTQHFQSIMKPCSHLHKALSFRARGKKYHSSLSWECTVDRGNVDKTSLILVDESLGTLEKNRALSHRTYTQSGPGAHKWVLLLQIQLARKKRNMYVWLVKCSRNKQAVCSSASI